MKMRAKFISATAMFLPQQVAVARVFLKLKAPRMALF